MRIIAAVMTMLLPCLWVAEAHGGVCLTRSRASSVFVVQSNIRFVPFAIPVAVPVAIINVPSVVYGYSGYSAAYRQQVQPVIEPQKAEAKVSYTAAEIVTNRCTKCHSGDEPKGGFNLHDANLAELDRDTRFKMLLRIMEPDKGKRMPKDGELSREEFDALVDSLVK